MEVHFEKMLNGFFLEMISETHGDHVGASLMLKNILLYSVCSGK